LGETLRIDRLPPISEKLTCAAHQKPSGTLVVAARDSADKQGADRLTANIIAAAANIKSPADFSAGLFLTSALL